MEKSITVRIKTEGSLDSLQEAILKVTEEQKCKFVSFKSAKRYKN